MKGKFTQFALGVLTGAFLFGGATAVAAGITAEPSWSPIFVDGRQVQLTAYNIAGNNYVKLRDIGQAVGFNVYYQNGVQVDSDAPYTGTAPTQTVVQPMQTQPVQTSTAASSIKVSSYKGNPLKAGDRSMLMMSPYGGKYTATSDNPSVAALEQVSGQWVIVPKSAGTTVISVANDAGETGSLTLTVEGSALPTPGPGRNIDLNANMDIRQEMIRLINQTRRANGVGELVVNEALMNAAQDSSTQMFRSHNSAYENGAALAYGYSHGFGDNLTYFTGSDYLKNVAQTAVNNWINSTYHFQTMISERYETIGVGVTIENGQACCYMFAGDSNTINGYLTNKAPKN